MTRLARWIFALALAPALPGWAQEIKLGSLNDLTGPTSDVGKDIALGMSPDQIWFIGFDNTIRRPQS